MALNTIFNGLELCLVLGILVLTIKGFSKVYWLKKNTLFQEISSQDKLVLNIYFCFAKTLVCFYAPSELILACDKSSVLVLLDVSLGGQRDCDISH